MEVLNITSYILILIIFIYTIVFSIHLWKNQIRAGSIFTFLLAVSILMSAYFVIR